MRKLRHREIKKLAQSLTVVTCRTGIRPRQPSSRAQALHLDAAHPERQPPAPGLCWDPLLGPPSSSHSPMYLALQSSVGIKALGGPQGQVQKSVCLSAPKSPKSPLCVHSLWDDSATCLALRNTEPTQRRKRRDFSFIWLFEALKSFKRTLESSASTQRVGGEP